MPWIKEEPVALVPAKVITQKKIFFNEIKGLSNKILFPRFRPPLQIFKIGLFLSFMLARPNGVNFRSEVQRKLKILYNFYGIHRYDKDVPHVGGHHQKDPHSYTLILPNAQKNPLRVLDDDLLHFLSKTLEVNLIGQAKS
jgi:hypothetical protein